MKNEKRKIANSFALLLRTLLSFKRDEKSDVRSPQKGMQEKPTLGFPSL